MNMRVAMFGGSFDPPHLGHLIFAEHARIALALDTILFIPASRSPFKPMPTATTVDHRCAMVSLAIEGNEHFSLDDCELRRGGTSYTIDTLRALRTRFPSSELYVLMGGDAYQDFQLWKEPAEIVRHARLGVGQRPGHLVFSTHHPYKEYADYFESPLIDVSSSGIRQYRQSELSIHYLVPETVRHFILQNNLYAQRS